MSNDKNSGNAWGISWIILPKQKKETPTRLRLFDYLDHHSNAHMGCHIITNDINKTIFHSYTPTLVPSMGCSLPKPNPFFNKKNTTSFSRPNLELVVSFFPQEESLPTFQAVEAKRKELARAPLPKDAAMLQRSFFQQLLGSRARFFGHQGIQLFGGGEVL